VDNNGIITDKIKKERSRLDRELISLASMLLPLMDTDEQRAEVRKLANEVRSLKNG
jgi:hypothetical protein